MADPARSRGAPSTFCKMCNRVLWVVDADSEGNCCFCTTFLSGDTPTDEEERVVAMHEADRHATDRIQTASYVDPTKPDRSRII